MTEAQINPFTGQPSTTSLEADSQLWDQLDQACDVIDANLTTAMKAVQAHSEDYYTVARTIREQVKQLRPHLKGIRRRIDRDEIRYRLDRAKYVVSFLDTVAPRVEGSGVLHSSGTGKHKRIEAVYAAGLPGLGQRR